MEIPTVRGVGVGGREEVMVIPPIGTMQRLIRELPKEPEHPHDNVRREHNRLRFCVDRTKRDIAKNREELRELRSTLQPARPAWQDRPAPRRPPRSTAR